ncbi:hypothetical protein ALMP_50080 [Streptomyces sp. A012304]|nr:hypothetical protein ALMP_50080 [Streptomyces sp. A012304]
MGDRLAQRQRDVGRARDRGGADGDAFCCGAAAVAHGAEKPANTAAAVAARHTARTLLDILLMDFSRYQVRLLPSGQREGHSRLSAFDRGETPRMREAAAVATGAAPVVRHRDHRPTRPLSTGNRPWHGTCTPTGEAWAFVPLPGRRHDRFCGEDAHPLG